MFRSIAFFFLFIGLATVSGASAQTPATGVKPSVIAGDATAVSEKGATVAAKSGPVEITFTGQTVFKKVSAVNPDFKTAADAGVADIGVGDKLTVTGILAADGKSMPARTVYFITKADIAAKNAQETQEWRRRGIAGKVTNVNTQTGQLTVEVRGLTSSTTSVITPKEGASFLKYAPDSTRFDEAIASSLAEIKPGDMLRALGDKSADGTSFSAERVITGAFQTIAGTITSVDAEKGEIVIKNLQDNKEMTVGIGSGTVMKRFPQEMAERLAGAQMMAAGGARPIGGARPVGAGQGARPAGAGGGQPGMQPGGRPGMGPGGAGGVDDMIDRFPNVSISELTVGDMIAFSSSKNGNPSRAKAIKLLAGVEPFLRMAQGPGGRRGQGVDGSFSIPGLDSFGP